MKNILIASTLSFLAFSAMADSVSSSSSASTTSSGNGAAVSSVSSTATNTTKIVTVNVGAVGNASAFGVGTATNSAGTVVVPKFAPIVIAPVSAVKTPVVVPTFTSRTTTKK